MQARKVGILGALLLQISTAIAINVPYQACFTQASKKYGVPEELLIAIAKVESKFNPNAINHNSNKSDDMGLMQINSIWLKQLETYGITKDRLSQPCQNIMVGAWILAQKIEAYGFTWTAIQRYNGSDPKLGYAQKVFASIKEQNPQLINGAQIAFSTQPTSKPGLPQIVIQQPGSKLIVSNESVNLTNSSNVSDKSSKFTFTSNKPITGANAYEEQSTQKPKFFISGQ